MKKKTGPKPVAAVDRFWKVVEKQEDGCWLYRGRRDVYGQLMVEGGKLQLAHRFSYIIHKGQIPTGLFICHKCDVRGCVNPDHLYAGTHEQNTQDIVDRKRHRKPKARLVRKVEFGRRMALPMNRKLRRADAEKIKEEYASGAYTQAELAYRWSVSVSTISATIRGVNNCGSGENKFRRYGNFRFKITEAQRQEIVEKYASGAFTQTQLAVEYGITQTRVSGIVTGLDEKRRIKSQLTRSDSP